MTTAASQVHTVWHAADRRWHVLTPGGVLHGVPQRLKENAVDDGRALARRLRAEHVVHNRDGRIAWCNSYGHDPNPPAG